MDHLAALLRGYQFNPHALPMALAALALVALGGKILSHDRHSKPCQLFFWFCLALADYFGCFTLVYLSGNPETALLWVRLAYLGVPLVPVLLFSFVGSLQERQPGASWLLILGWGLAGMFMLSALASNWLIAGVQRYWWGYYKHYGVLGPVFLLYAVVYGCLCAIYYRRLRAETKENSRSCQRLALHQRALLVGSFIAVDFVAGFGWPLYAFGYLPALILVGTLFTAVRRYGPVFFTPVLAPDTVLEIMGEALFVLDEDGLVGKINHAAEVLLGRPRREMLGQPLGSLLPLEPIQNGARDLFAPGAPSSREVSFIDQQGQARFLNITANALTNNRGDTLAALCIMRDVTQERQAQRALRQAHDLLEHKVKERTQDLSASNQALLAENQQRRLTEALLRQSEEKYRLLVDNAQEAIFICQQGFIRFCNQRTQEIFGFAPDYLMGRRFQELFHPGQEQPWPGPSDVDDAPPGTSSQGGIMRALTKEGRVISVQPQAVSITWEGRPASLYFLHDVSAQKEMEAQLAHTSKLQALGTLASGIAHDFNNLLQAIAGYAHLLQKSLPPRCAQWRYLEEISHAVDRGSQLVKSLLGYGRQLPASSQAVDINQLLLRVVDLLEHTIPKMTEIRLSLDPDLPLIVGEPAQLEQVMLNLGANAHDAMPGGGVIEIASRRVSVAPGEMLGGQALPAGPYVLITVGDNGYGMDGATLTRAFEPFFTTKELGQGTGLGLFMAYGVAQRHGGHIFCESRLGQGTTFHIYLPVPPREPLREAAPLEKRSPPSQGTEAILLVDDERQVLEPASEALSQCGYRVFLAGSAEEALQIVRQAQVVLDLVVLDLGMPGMGGQEGLRQLKQLAPELKVIIASGYDMQQTRQSVAQLGASLFLAKPYSLRDLLAAVRQAMDSG